MNLPFGVNVAGYAVSASGTGEGVRSDIRGLQAAGIPYVVNNITHTYAGEQTTVHLPDLASDNPYAINLIHVNADQMELFALEMGEEYFARRYNIGYWTWELAEFPSVWAAGFEYLDEVWVPSSFVLDAVSRVASCPVIRMPHCVPIDPPCTARQRSDFGLDERKCLFLFMFDFYSSAARKNPLGLIEAFKTAFGGSDEAQLVLKCLHPEFDPDAMQAISRASGAQIRLLDAVMTREETSALLQLCDCYVSLHRSEGFGLTLAEAMSMGKPVIASPYSGNADFMSVSNSFLVRYNLVEIAQDQGPYKKGQAWADPDIEHAAALMRLMRGDRERAAACGRRAKRDIAQTLAPAATGTLMRQRLVRIKTDRPTAFSLRQPLTLAHDSPAFLQFSRRR